MDHIGSEGSLIHSDLYYYNNIWIGYTYNAMEENRNEKKCRTRLKVSPIFKLFLVIQTKWCKSESEFYIFGG